MGAGGGGQGWWLWWARMQPRPLASGELGCWEVAEVGPGHAGLWWERVRGAHVAALKVQLSINTKNRLCPGWLGSSGEDPRKHRDSDKRFPNS